VQLQDGLFTDPRAARAHLVSWLAQGTRDIAWALASVPRSRWIEEPPTDQLAYLGTWSALRHVRHLSLGLSEATVPAVRFVLGEVPAHRLPAPGALQRIDAAWDPQTTLDRLDGLLRGLGEARSRCCACWTARPSTSGCNRCRRKSCPCGGPAPSRWDSVGSSRAAINTSSST